MAEPLQYEKLEAAGIKDVEAFKETLRNYMKRDKNGVITDMDLAGLARDNATALAKLRTLVDYQAQRCITQETIGTTNLLKESSPFWRVFFQFKDFTMRATHSQTLRAVFNHELDDVMSTILVLQLMPPQLLLLLICEGGQCLETMSTNVRNT